MKWLGNTTQPTWQQFLTERLSVLLVDAKTSNCPRLGSNAVWVDASCARLLWFSEPLQSRNSSLPAVNSRAFWVLGRISTCIMPQKNLDTWLQPDPPQAKKVANQMRLNVKLCSLCLFLGLCYENLWWNSALSKRRCINATVSHIDYNYYGWWTSAAPSVWNQSLY